MFGALVFRPCSIFVGVAAIEPLPLGDLRVRGDPALSPPARLLRAHGDRRSTRARSWRWLAQHLPVTRRAARRPFFVRDAGKRVATPLLLAVVAVELTDIVFAIDSVPAAFAVRRRPVRVYSSNAFAILGLRSLYIVLEDRCDLRYLHFGLAAVLAFAGAQAARREWSNLPPLVSVGIIAACIAAALLAERPRPRQHPTARNKYITHLMPGPAQTPNLMGVPR